MADGFAELHCHSDFSFLDGASTADDLVERALELGLSALAVTDHQGLYGVVRFAAAAREAGLHPVVGMEVELVDSIVPDPDGLVVPRRRRPPRHRAIAADRELPAWPATGSRMAIRPPPDLAARGSGPGALAAAGFRPPALAARGSVPGTSAVHGFRLPTSAAPGFGPPGLAVHGPGPPGSAASAVLAIPASGLPSPTALTIPAFGRGPHEPSVPGFGLPGPGATPAPDMPSPAVDGTPSPRRAERKRPPGHREPLREDLRGVAPRELGPHLVLLARDTSGYRSLCRLASAAHLAGSKGVPHFTHALLRQHTEGLIALTGCRHGEVPRRLLAGDREGAELAARRLAGLYGEDLFVELQHHLLPDDDWLVAELARLASELGLPTLVTNDVHYALPEGRELQDVLVGIRHGLTLDACAHLRRPNGEYHVKGESELRALPPGLPDADPLVRRAWSEGLAATGEVAARCSVELEFERYRFPGFPVPRGETAFSELERLCHDGARRRYHPLTPRVVKQLAHELEVIERTGLAEFFLICWDLMRFCRERGIPAQGRGSAGDSILAYVLGITRVDPIRHDLLFERFINEGRTTYPDVDIDFASSRREEVIQYVYERYGTEHTGMVCNVVTYRARSAVREVGYALGFPRPLVDRVAKALETYDSVMVRRDLEAEGGFAEFFQAAGSAAAGDAAAACVASSPATGGSLPQAVAAASATEAARIVAERTAALAFVDPMGELAHGRGGRMATGGDEEHGTGRLARRGDIGRTEGGARAVASRGSDSAPDALAPRTELRPGPSDDEGGPGDSPASVRWLRAESERRAEIAGMSGSVLPFRRAPVGSEGSPGEAAGSHPSLLPLPGPGFAGPWGRLPPAIAPGMVGGQVIDPGTGVLLPAQRPKRMGRGGDRAPAAAPAGVPAAPTLPAPAPAAPAAGESPTPPRLPAGSWRPAWAASSSIPSRRDHAAPRSASHRGIAGLSCAPASTACPATCRSTSAACSSRRRPLVDIAPLERATMPGRVVVQFDKRDIETIKLIKLDLLGLRMLSAIDDALRDISVDCAVHVDLDRLPEDIPEVFRMIQAADTVGVFQIESRAQMQTLPRSRPTTLDDLVVEVAIIRPGPIQGNAVHPYLRRRQGIEPVTYLHPSLEPALKETLGVILYQEQVMKIAIDVAGFSAGESDGFRRAMGTWRSRKEMEKLHARFVGRLHGGQRPHGRAGGGAVREGRGVRQLRLQQEPRGGVRPHGLRVGVPQALLPGAVRDRADQRAADGLLPGGGAHQRRQAARRGGAPRGRQPQPVPHHDRVGGHAR